MATTRRSVFMADTRTSGYQAPSLLVLTGAVIAGGVAGWLICQAWPGTGRGVDAFRRDPWYAVWCAMGAFNCALWLCLGYLGFRQLRGLMTVPAPGASGWRNGAGRLVGVVVAYLALGLVITTLATGV